MTDSEALMASASPSAVFKSSGQTFTDGVLIEKGSGEDEEEEVELEGEEEEGDFWPAPPQAGFFGVCVLVSLVPCLVSFVVSFLNDFQSS